MRRVLIAFALILLALGALAAAPQQEQLRGSQISTNPENEYLLLATTKTSTMQKELDAAAGKGYRIVVGSPAVGAEMVLLLEKSATPPDIFKYKLLATLNTGTMEREINATAAEGYRLMPRTVGSPGTELEFAL